MAPSLLRFALSAVAAERMRQDLKFGANRDFPDGTGTDPAGDVELRELAQKNCDEAFRAGEGTWRHILEEEFLEAMAETDEVKLEKELVQVAAVAVAWVEALQARRAIGKVG